MNVHENIILALAVICLLLIFLIIYFLPRFLLPNNSGCVFYSDTQNQKIALTIDDGPFSKTTDEILDVLQENNAHATFFIITDHLHENEHIIHRMLNEGHEIGNHNTKDEMSIRLSDEEFHSQLMESHQALSTYDLVKWYRPGWGLYNEHMLNQIKGLNYTCVLGSIFANDPKMPWVWHIKLHLQLNARPGAIIILHDGEERGVVTASVLRETLPLLRQRGYEIVTLSELLLP